MAQTVMHPVLPIKTKLILSVKWNVANKQSVKHQIKKNQHSKIP